MNKLIKALEEKEQWYYDDVAGMPDNSRYRFLQITKGNMVADCIQLVKEHLQDHVLVPLSKLNRYDVNWWDQTCDKEPDGDYVRYNDIVALAYADQLQGEESNE